MTLLIMLEVAVAVVTVATVVLLETIVFGHLKSLTMREIDCPSDV